MKNNISSFDRLIRFLISLGGVLLILIGQINGIYLFLIGAVSLIMFVTAAVNFCPLYTLLGISTRR